MKRMIVGALALVLTACGAANSQTHYNLTNNQNFTVANAKPLSGTYECTSDATIKSCNINGGSVVVLNFLGGTTSTNTGTARYFGNATVTATQEAANIRVPVAGTIKSLYCGAGSTVGTLPQQYVFNVVRNNGALSMGCTMPSTDAISCSDTTRTDTVAAGDKLSIVAQPSGTPNAVTVECSLVLVTTAS